MAERLAALVRRSQRSDPVPATQVQAIDANPFDPGPADRAKVLKAECVAHSPIEERHGRRDGSVSVVAAIGDIHHQSVRRFAGSRMR